MSDDDSDNILNFPHEIVAKRYIDLEIRDEQMHTENRKSVLALLKNTEKTVNENETINGAVCLLFHKDNTMIDLMGGNVNATNLYVMLDKVKMDMMQIICTAYGITDEEEE
tara:strand:+ start:15 stop:347 length:333 start_codon:yes stop_codon:yes gene_type:complete